MNLYLYIPFHSFHTPAAKRAFILTELMRYIRNSSDEKDYVELKQIFFQRLRDRGYPSSFLEPEFNSIFYSDRPYFLFPSSSLHLHPSLFSSPPQSLCLQRRLARITATGTLPSAAVHPPSVFIIPYTPLSALVPTRTILTHYWEQLRLTKFYAEKSKPIIAYQSTPALAKTLVFSKARENDQQEGEHKVQSRLERFFG
jgi:hypothetical protein